MGSEGKSTAKERALGEVEEIRSRINKMMVETARISPETDITCSSLLLALPWHMWL